MQTNEAAIEMINDLIKINNDRIAGYQKAIEEATEQEADLKPVFEKMIEESKEYKQQLINKAIELGDENIEDNTSTAGDIYRAWMDLKATFSDNPETVLDSCEFGEDAWRRAYESALNDEELSEELEDLLQSQYDSEKNSHDLIRQKRNEYRAS